jgi:alkylation response protein AidB-like acyl-CoA dehydrogenase
VREENQNFRDWTFSSTHPPHFYLLRIAATHAVRTCAEITRRMHELGGGTSVYETCPLQRRFRDAHVATQHIMVAPGSLELAGRALLGIEGDYGQL